MVTIYEQIASVGVKVVCTIISIIFTAVIVPWLKNTVIPWLREKRLYNIVNQYVLAAEKLCSTGAIAKDAKKEYVTNLLANRGVAVNESVNAMIEAAVQELDLAWIAGVSQVIETFKARYPYEEDYDDLK